MQLTIAINFSFSKDIEEQRVMHLSSDKKNLYVIVMRMILSHLVQNIKKI